jgi:hypothetical protein
LRKKNYFLEHKKNLLSGFSKNSALLQLKNIKFILKSLFFLIILHMASSVDERVFPVVFVMRISKQKRWRNMGFLKSETLFFRNDEKTSKSSDGKNALSQKVKLSVHKAPDRVKIYRPLKRRKIKLHKIKIINNKLAKEFSRDEGRATSPMRNEWSDELTMINWLASLNIYLS